MNPGRRVGWRDRWLTLSGLAALVRGLLFEEAPAAPDPDPPPAAAWDWSLAPAPASPWAVLPHGRLAVALGGKVRGLAFGVQVAPSYARGGGPSRAREVRAFRVFLHDGFGAGDDARDVLARLGDVCKGYPSLELYEAPLGAKSTGPLAHRLERPVLTSVGLVVRSASAGAVVLENVTLVAFAPAADC